MAAGWTIEVCTVWHVPGGTVIVPEAGVKLTGPGLVQPPCAGRPRNE